MQIRGLFMIGSHASAFLLLLGLAGCGAPAEPDSPRLKITSDIQSNPESPFFLPLAEYPVKRNRLPIGVFDSGTGGLTVLDAILKLDRFRNRTLEASPDQLPDFAGEEFVYLADSANIQPSSLGGTNGQADRVEFGEQAVHREIGANVGVGQEGDAFFGHEVDAALDNTLFELEFGDAQGE